LFFFGQKQRKERRWERKRKGKEGKCCNNDRSRNARGFPSCLALNINYLFLGTVFCSGYFSKLRCSLKFNSSAQSMANKSAQGMKVFFLQISFAS